jgi:hypothetical protein
MSQCCDPMISPRTRTYVRGWPTWGRRQGGPRTDLPPARERLTVRPTAESSNPSPLVPNTQAHTANNSARPRGMRSGGAASTADDGDDDDGDDDDDCGGGGGAAAGVGVEWPAAHEPPRSSQSALSSRWPSRQIAGLLAAVIGSPCLGVCTHCDSISRPA